MDNGYYKKSMQEIDKLLKKNKDWPYLKVLKALACIRMNRKNEGIEMLNSVCNDAPYDDSTLQTMTICFRDLNKRMSLALFCFSERLTNYMPVISS